MAQKFGPHVERLHAVAASPSRRLLAIGGARDVRAASPAAVPATVHVLAMPKVKAERALPVPGAAYALCFAGNSNDELLLAGLATGAIVGWDPTVSGETDSGPATPRLIDLGDAHRGAVRGLACDPTGATLASVGDDGMLRLWALS
ncbi:MAG: hypothetical protein AAGC55_27915, partial [Myxococcota bacterium]